MSTNSTINIEWSGDRTVSSVYCHMDGYLEYNGALLAIFHNSIERARQLLSRGSLSSLGMDTPGLRCRAVANFSEGSVSLGEHDPSTPYNCVEELRGEEYNYVWSAKYAMWFVECDVTEGEFRPLHQVLTQHASQWLGWRLEAAALGVQVGRGL